MTPKILISLGLLFALDLSAQEAYQQILNMMSKEKNVRHVASQRLLQLNDISLAPAMGDVLFYIPRSARGEMVDLLQKITKEKIGNDYYRWVEYIGSDQNLKAPPGYTKFKVALLALIDPNCKKILYTGVPVSIRPEEIVWGGVQIDGIPPIDSPILLEASKAKLKDAEKVFGILVQNEARAYPLRYLSWHEMLNENIAGEPITVSY
jgi:Protein of unknown function (DUF3179)